MRKVTCKDCGRRYDYDVDDFCPKCGSYNPPADSGATRLEQEMLARFQGGQANQQRTAQNRPKPAPRHATAPMRSPGYHPTYGSSPDLTGRTHTGRIQDCAACEEPGRKRGPAAVLLVAVLVIFVVTAACLIFAFNALSSPDFGSSLFSVREEPAAVEAEPGTYLHTPWEAFSLNGMSVTVEDIWAPVVPDSILPDGQRCIAVDLWVEDGTRSDLTYSPPMLVLEDGGSYDAVDDDPLLSRKLKDAGVYDVTLSDAQWSDPLYGQLVFFVPEDAQGEATLLLPEGLSAATGAPSVWHSVSFDLP